MAIKFFGQFLVEKGIVTREQLLAALALQETTNLRFGEMAKAMGLLDDEQVRRVHNAQHTQDMRFGDIALSIGLLTEAQVQAVLGRQKDTYIYLGAALVRVGALNDEQLQEALAAFKEDQAPYAVDALVIPAGVPKPQVWEAAADLTFKMLTRMANLPHRAEQSRLVEVLEKNEVMACMELTGTIHVKFVLSVSSGVRAAIARTMLREEAIEQGPDELLNDAVMEFVNIVCGNLAAKVASFGERIELSPPEVIEASAQPFAVPEDQLCLLFPIHVVSGERVEMAVIIIQ